MITCFPSLVNTPSLFMNASTSGLAFRDSSAIRSAAAPEGASGATDAVAADFADGAAAEVAAGGAVRSAPCGAAVAQAKSRATIGKRRVGVRMGAQPTSACEGGQTACAGFLAGLTVVP